MSLKRKTPQEGYQASMRVSLDNRILHERDHILRIDFQIADMIDRLSVLNAEREKARIRIEQLERFKQEPGLFV